MAHPGAQSKRHFWASFRRERAVHGAGTSRASIGPVVKVSVCGLAASALLQLAGCGGSLSGSAHNSSEDAQAMDGHAFEDDAPDGSPLDDDADASDAGDSEADAPGAIVSLVPLLHRATAAACTQPRPAGTANPACNPYGDEAGPGGYCGSDPDCTAGTNGRCNCFQGGPAVADDGNWCSYDGCASDSDCNGGVCDCRESPAHVTWGTQTVCLGGNCRTDSDCGPGGYCSPSPLPGCGAQSWYAYFCHTPGDQCVNDTDCNQGNAYCAYEASSSRWVCSTGMCPDG